MTQTVIDLVEKINLHYRPKQTEELLGLFAHIPVERASRYFDSLRHLDLVAPRLETNEVDRLNLEKGALTFLAIIDLLYTQPTSNYDAPGSEPEGETFERVAQALYSVNLLPSPSRQAILLGALAIGLVMAERHPDHPSGRVARLVIGELHVRGGFQPSLWGSSINLDLLPDLLASFGHLSAYRLQHLLRQHASLRIRDLPIFIAA